MNEYFRGGVFVQCDEATYNREYKKLGYLPFNVPTVKKSLTVEKEEVPEQVAEVKRTRKRK